MDAEILKELISELLDTKEMLVVIDSAGAVSEMDTSEVAEPEFHDEWATIESRGWHLHLNMNSVDGVQFVEAEDQRHDSIPRLYYVRLSDAEGRTVIRFYFPNPWRTTIGSQPNSSRKSCGSSSSSGTDTWEEWGFPSTNASQPNSTPWASFAAT